MWVVGDLRPQSVDRCGGLLLNSLVLVCRHAAILHRRHRVHLLARLTLRLVARSVHAATAVPAEIDGALLRGRHRVELILMMLLCSALL